MDKLLSQLNCQKEIIVEDALKEKLESLVGVRCLFFLKEEKNAQKGIF